MRKYYGYFIFDEHEYVIRFKIDGSLRWHGGGYGSCFMDDEMYVRSAKDVILLAALRTNSMNCKHCTCAYLISHDDFRRYRAQGIKRFEPWNPIIHWK